MTGHPFPELSIREAGPADADLIADILAEAFADDQMLSWTLGGPGRARGMFGALAKRVYLKHGFGHVIGETAATLWLPAGADAQLSFMDEFAVGLATLRETGARAVARLKAVGDILAAHRPKAAHYYLFAVGVREGCKGMGQGGHAIRAGLGRVDEDGALAYLENSKDRNTPLYQRLGFEITGKIQTPAGSPGYLSMLRKPKREAF